MQFINDFKTMTMQQYMELEDRRLSVNEQQLEAVWQRKTLIEMSDILTIDDDYIVNYLASQLIPPYLNSKKITYEAFIGYQSNDKGEEVPIIYVYDCKLFRSHSYTKEENDFISSFILCYKENVVIQQPIHEIVDPDSVPPNRWILKIRQSALLKTFSNIKEIFRKLPCSNDKIILDPTKYYFFIQHWMKCYYNYNIEITVSSFFKGIMALLENQILREYFKTLSREQKEEKMYRRPIKIIEKPKNIEQFTLTQNRFGEIAWQTLKIVAYKLKYRIQQDEDRYKCYRIKEQSEGGASFEQLSSEDQNILLALQGLRRQQSQYQQRYQQL